MAAAEDLRRGNLDTILTSQPYALGYRCIEQLADDAPPFAPIVNAMDQGASDTISRLPALIPSRLITQPDANAYHADLVSIQRGEGPLYTPAAAPIPGPATASLCEPPSDIDETTVERWRWFIAGVKRAAEQRGVEVRRVAAAASSDSVPESRHRWQLPIGLRVDQPSGNLVLGHFDHVAACEHLHDDPLLRVGVSWSQTISLLHRWWQPEGQTWWVHADAGSPAITQLIQRCLSSSLTNGEF